MVAPLGPGKFYGSSLPRPRIYTDVRLNDERIDPPVPVMDPLLAWADEAHWSMGGLSFTRHRLQGRIEGNVDRLRVQREKAFEKSQKRQTPTKGSTSSDAEEDENSSGVGQTQSPPPAPMVIKRRRVLGLVDEDDEEEEQRGTKRGTARRLGDDFERVARESGMDAEEAANGSSMVAARTRSKRNAAADVVVNKGKVNKGKRKLVAGGRRAVATPPATRSSARLLDRSPTVRQNV